MKKVSIKQQILRGALLLTVTGLMGAANAADFTVDQVSDDADANPGDGSCATLGGNCTLRAAVMETNVLAGADTITIPAGTYTLGLGNTGEDLAAEGDLDILDDLTITGADPATTTINGNSFAYRVFSILKRDNNSMPVVAISNLTLTQGLSDSNGALIYNAGELTLDNVTLTDASLDSRAMVNEGNFTLDNSRIDSNDGGIYSNSGNVTISNSVFINNVSTIRSGAAFYIDSGAATISDTDFLNNTSRVGGAVYIGGGTLTFDNCRFNENKAVYPSYDNRAKGGAIYSSGYVNISNSSFDFNQSEDDGGALYLDSSSANIADSTFSNNIASNGGGGIYANLSGNDDLRIKRIKITRNQATNDGGGIFVSLIKGTDRFLISESVVENNTAGDVGGGIVVTTAYNYRDHISVLRRMTISNNTASYGGGVYTNVNNFTLQDTTITNNTAKVDGGGLYQNTDSDKGIELIHLTIANNSSPVNTGSNIRNKSGIIRLNNTLIANPVDGNNCTGSFTTLGYNLSSDASCGLSAGSDQVNTDPLLSTLANNGGFSKTMALQDDSPAINAGNTVLCASLNPLDQRYFYRGDTACDIGAYEADSALAQSGTLAFSSASFSVSEGVGTGTVTFSRTGGSEGNVGMLVYDTELGTAGAGYPGNDYDAIPSTWIEWADDDSSDKELNITINDDGSIEGNETINLQLESLAYSYLITHNPQLLSSQIL